jgi:hypothetical protein
MKMTVKTKFVEFREVAIGEVLWDPGSQQYFMKRKKFERSSFVTYERCNAIFMTDAFQRELNGIGATFGDYERVEVLA